MSTDDHRQKVEEITRLKAQAEKTHDTMYDLYDDGGVRRQYELAYDSLLSAARIRYGNWSHGSSGRCRGSPSTSAKSTGINSCGRQISHDEATFAPPCVTGWKLTTSQAIVVRRHRLVRRRFNTSLRGKRPPCNAWYCRCGPSNCCSLSRLCRRRSRQRKERDLEKREVARMEQRSCWSEPPAFRRRFDHFHHR